MSVWKVVLLLIVLGAVVVFAYDGVEILNAHRDVRNAASASASAAAQAITSTKDRAKARTIADSTAKAHGDVVIDFTYDPVAAKVRVTVSGNASSLVIHLLDKNLTNNIKASASARPG
jgi:Flp pilus assembly protein TadG